jgi:8-oxo-dGTP pyrophosphatase MutT (NUDIX family)
MAEMQQEASSALNEQTARALAGVLDTYQRRVVRVPERRLAAVLIPLFERNDEPWVVLTKRTEQVATHKGQISFPGGTQDPEDTDLWDTAIRETEEELGVARASIRRVGVLDDYPTFSSGFIVTAFVGELLPPPAWEYSRGEIEHVIELPLRRLAEEGRVERWERDGIRFPMSIFEVDGHYVWGVTAFILRRFLDLVGPALGLPTPIGDAPIVP